MSESEKLPRPDRSLDARRIASEYLAGELECAMRRNIKKVWIGMYNTPEGTYDCFVSVEESK